MSPIQGLLCLIVCFFLPNVIYLLLGSALVKTRRFHKLGVRMLAMCMLISGRRIASSCHQDCENVHCGNWTCAKYAKPMN